MESFYIIYTVWRPTVSSPSFNFKITHHFITLLHTRELKATQYSIITQSGII